MAIGTAGRQLMWLKHIYKELEYMLKDPIPLCCDNSGAVFMANNPNTDR